MMKNKTVIEPHITWKIYSGNNLCWWNDRLGEGQLTQHCKNITSLNNTLVSYYLANGSWYEILLRQEVPSLLIPKILSYKFHVQSGIGDTLVWESNENGVFSCNLARRICGSTLSKYIWHKHIPLKYSSFCAEIWGLRFQLMHKLQLLEVHQLTVLVAIDMEMMRSIIFCQWKFF